MKKNVMFIMICLTFACTDNSINSSDELIPGATITRDAHDGAIIPGHIDIDEIHSLVTDKMVACAICMKELPESLLFNQSLVPLNYLEYSWRIKFTPSATPAIAYEFAIDNFKLSTNTERLSPILEACQENVWKEQTDSTSYLIDVHAERSGNCLIMRLFADSLDSLYNLLQDAQVDARTLYYDGQVIIEDQLNAD